MFKRYTLGGLIVQVGGDRFFSYFSHAHSLGGSRCLQLGVHLTGYAHTMLATSRSRFLGGNVGLGEIS